MIKKLRILLVDDDKEEYFLVKEMLAGRSYLGQDAEPHRFEVEWVNSYEAALQAFDTRQHEVYFIDYHLGSRNGLNLLSEAAARGIESPIIILTSHESHELDIAAAQAGAADYLVKQHVNGLLLERAIRYALQRKRVENSLRKAQAELEARVQERTQELLSVNHKLQGEIQERVRAQEALNQAKNLLEVQVEQRTAELQRANEQLAETNRRLHAVLAALPLAVWIADADGKIVQKNEIVDGIWGVGAPLPDSIYEYGVYRGWWAETGVELKPEDWALARAVTKGETSLGEVIDIQRFDDSLATILCSAAPIISPDGRIAGGIAINQDITTQRWMEREAKSAAAEAQRRVDELNAIFKAMNEAVMVYDRQGIPQRANIAAWTGLGLDPDAGLQELVDIQHLITHPDGRMLGVAELPVRRALLGESIQGERYSLVNHTGQDAIILVSASPLYTADQVAGAVLVWRDVTERENLFSQLEAERARMSILIASAPEAIVVADKNGEMMLANPVADQLFGMAYSRAGDQELQFCYPDGTPYNPRDLPLARSALDGETQINLELAFLGQNGRRRYALVNSAPVLDRMGNVNGAIALFQDITKRKWEEEETRKNAVRIEVQHQLIQARETERLRIAKEVHDGPIQDLFAICYAVSDVQEMVTNTSGQQGLFVDSLRVKLDGVQHSLQQEVQKLRNLTSELRPPALVPFGLEKAIRSHADLFQKTHPGLQVKLDLMPDGKTLPEEMRLALFRIYQELLDNVARHAKSNRVLIHLALDEDSVTLEVRDYGVGFEVLEDWTEFAHQGKLGLVSVQERVTAMSGTIHVTSVPGKGTSIRSLIPIASQE